LKSVFKPIISSFETVFTVFKNILKFFGRFNLFGLIIFGIIDFITGFIDKFKAADSLGEGILEGLWGGFTNVIRGFIAIPLDLLKDLTSWIAEKLGFSEVAKVLDSFSFVDLFNKATEWLYNTETDTWFGGALDDLGSLGEGILEGLWGGYTNVIRDFIYIPLDMLKDLTSWIAEKLGFSEVAKVLDSFSFVDLFDKATKWLYDTETNIWFGGALDDLPEKMKTLYTDLKTKLESFIKDYIYDGSGDKIKLFGQELPTFDDIGNWATSIKEKIGNFIKDNIYDGENNKIFGFTIPEKLFEFNMFTSIKQSVDDVIKSIEKIFSGDFSMENLLQGASGLLDLVQAPLNLAINAIKDIFKWGEGEEGASEPFRLSKFIADTISNITNAIKDMFAWADEKFGFNITGTLKNFANMIYNPETGEIFGLNFEDLFDVFPSIDDIKKKLTGLIPDMFLGGGGDDTVDLSASTLDPGADEVDLKKLKKELDAGNEKAVMKYLSDTKSGDGIENEEEVLKILKTYGFYDGIISPRAFEDDSIPQAAEGGITPKPPGSSARNAESARIQARLEKKSAREKAADTNGDGKVSRAERVALLAKEDQERADLFGTTDLGAALDAGSLDGAGARNTSTIVPNGTDNTSTNFSDMMDAYDAKILALVEGGHEITGELMQKLLLETFSRGSDNGTNDTSNSKLIPLTTAPVTGAAVESGSQAVNEINSQAPIVNVVSDSSSKVNAPVTSTVVNYTPGSSNARNSDNSVRQFSINALSSL
jgi:hypothetical protein